MKTSLTNKIKRSMLYFISSSLLVLSALAAPIPQTVAPKPVAGQMMPGAMVATSVLNQFGDTSSKIQQMNNANAITAVRNFFGDVALVSNAISLIGSGEVTDPQTMANLAQVAFNAEIDENNQRMVMYASGGGQALSVDANNNILTFTPTVLNGLQHIAQQPNDPMNQQIALDMGTVRNARILTSIGNLAESAIGGSMPVTSVIQATTQESTVQDGAAQDRNSATLKALLNNAPAPGGPNQQTPLQQAVNSPRKKL